MKAETSLTDERFRILRKLPIEMVPVREPLAMEAGRIKAGYRISFADAFGVTSNGSLFFVAR
ncbi:MAG TPA: hypothetical protein VLS93_15875 [Anaeromyxobacteraceae bacterium]|nr:hypothetical protein [Anaeromyxobacteraceae bacterium]